MSVSEEICELEKENLKLKQRLEKAINTLEFYASGQHIDAASFGSSYAIRIEDGTKAKEALKECGV